MDVLARMFRNTGYSVRVNHKVSTTAAANNKQGDVELVSFALDGYNSLVIDVSICCDNIGNSTINNGHLNGKMHTNDYLQARAGAKNGKYKEDYAAVGTAFAPTIVSVTGQIHPEFLRLLWVLADKQTHNYYALIGAEEKIGSEAFTWSSHIVSTRTLLARPLLMPLPHAYTYPCTVQLCRRVDKLASPFHLLNASCTAMHMHCNAHLLGPHPLAGARNSAYNDAQSDNDDDEPADVLEAILGQVGEREDTGFDKDGVDVSVGVNADTIVGVSVHGQGVNLGVGLGVGTVDGGRITQDTSSRAQQPRCNHPS
jgi:hypothetical protein